MPGGHVSYDARYPDLAYESANTPSSGPTAGALALVDNWSRVTGLPNTGPEDIFNNRQIVGGSGLSVHAEGRAADLSANALNPEQRRLANNYIVWLIQNARQLGVQYIIFNEWSWRANRGWAPYSGSGKNPHTDHVHVELTRAAAANPSPMWSQQPNVAAYAYGESSVSSAGQPAPAQAGGFVGGASTAGGAVVSDSDKGNGQVGAAYSPTSPGISSTSTSPLPGETPEQFARRTYGYLGWFLDEPEIGPIILQAATEGWDISRLQGALANTDWWKNTTESARLWDAELASDPATAASKIKANAAIIEDLAGTLGLTLDPNKIFELATNTLRFGIDPNSAEFRNSLAGLLPAFNPSTSQVGTGTFQQAYDEIRRLARSEFLIGIADADAWRLAQDVIAGNITLDGVKTMFMGQAKGRFGQLSAQIDAGITPGQFFSTYRNAIADTLEMSADQIDFLDPRWSDVISHTDAGGELRPMTISETLRYARSQPEWEHTDRAKGAGANSAKKLAESMGVARF